MIVFSLSGSVPFLFASLRFPRFPPSSDSRKEEANSGRPFRDEWLKWLSASGIPERNDSKSNENELRTKMILDSKCLPSRLDPSSKDRRDDSLCRPGFLVSNSGRLRPLSGSWTISLDWALTLSSSEREYKDLFPRIEFPETDEPSSGRLKDFIVIPILFCFKKGL